MLAAGLRTLSLRLHDTLKTEIIMSETAIYLSERDAELFKEFCRQYDAYTTVISKVLDVKGGNVNLLIDDQGLIRKIQTSKTFLINIV